MAISFPSDAEILARLAAGEDGFVERKSVGDWKKDAVKTCVAFANSCPVDGPPGILCIGVKDDGAIENSRHDLDTLQKTLERELEEAYPAIPHHTRIVASPNGRFVAVVVPGSFHGPHFAGPAYVRIGSSTAKSNQEQFERLVDKRERKVREILKWKNKTIKLVRTWARPNNLSGRVAGFAHMTVIDCDSFTVKLKIEGSAQFLFFSLELVTLGRDAEANCLTIEVPQD